MQLQGGCLCKAVRWQATAAPLVTRHCWCRDCQYIGAGSGTVNMMMRRDQVSLSGATGSYASRADSGNTIERHFCASCGRRDRSSWSSASARSTTPMPWRRP